jgi:hypothetical protein
MRGLSKRPSTKQLRLGAIMGIAALHRHPSLSLVAATLGVSLSVGGTNTVERSELNALGFTASVASSSRHLRDFKYDPMAKRNMAVEAIRKHVLAKIGLPQPVVEQLLKPLTPTADTHPRIHTHTHTHRRPLVVIVNRSTPSVGRNYNFTL